MIRAVAAYLLCLACCVLAAGAVLRLPTYGSRAIFGPSGKPGGTEVRRVFGKNRALLLLACWAYGCAGAASADVADGAPPAFMRQQAAPGDDPDAQPPPDVRAIEDLSLADLLAAPADASPDAPCPALAACPSGVTFNVTEGSVVHDVWFGPAPGVRAYCATGCRDRVHGVPADLHARCLTAARGDNGAAEIWCAPDEAACYACGDRGAP